MIPTIRGNKRETKRDDEREEKYRIEKKEKRKKKKEREEGEGRRGWDRDLFTGEKTATRRRREGEE